MAEYSAALEAELEAKSEQLLARRKVLDAERAKIERELGTTWDALRAARKPRPPGWKPKDRPPVDCEVAPWRRRMHG